MRPRHRPTFRAACLALAASALGYGGAESQTAEPRTEPARAGQSASGSGTLTFAAEAWEFEGADCAFGGETEPRGARTLVAVIQDGTRQIFIEAGRTANRDGSITHSLTVSFPEPGLPAAYAPTYFVNHIGRVGGAWVNQAGEPVSGPLFRIDEGRLATGQVAFEDPATGGTYATGSLTAECPS